MAIGPIDYLSMIQKSDPVGDFAQGYQLGNAIHQRNLQDQQQAQAAQLQQQYASDLQATMQNPTPQNMAAMIAKYPAQKEALTGSFSMLDDDQKKSELNSASQVYSALLNGNYDVAKQQLDGHISAMEEKGQDASGLKNLRDTLTNDPNAATAHAGLVISSLMGPQQFIQTFGGLGKEAREQQLQPFNVAKTGAEASQAVTTAQNMPTKYDLENTQTAQNIVNSRDQQKLNDLDSQIKAADSETKRGQLQLERDKLQAEINKNNQAAQGSPQQNQQAMDSITSALGSIGQIKNSNYYKKSLDQEGWYNTKIGTASGKAMSVVPGTEAYDFNALVDQLKSQQFLQNIQNMRGMGALSDAEGKKINDAIAVLDRNMSPSAFKNALGTIESTMNRAQNRLAAKGKLPTQGQGVVTNVPGYGVVDEGQVNQMMKAVPGATREDVLNFLKVHRGQ